MPKKRMAVGYIRVSTPGQESDGAGLQKQERAIRELAAASGLELVQVYDDTASAVGKDSHLRRPGLQAALVLAKMHRAPLIVWRLRTAENMSKGTRKGHARRQARGERSGRTDLEGLKEARGLAAEAIRDKKAEHRELLVATLRRHPDLCRKTAAEVAAGLNALGVLSGRGLPWTTAGIRRPLGDALALIRERQELEGLSWDDFGHAEAEDASPAVELGRDADEHPYKDHPTYGIF